MLLLDITVVIVALPSIREDLGGNFVPREAAPTPRSHSLASLAGRPKSTRTRLDTHRLRCSRSFSRRRLTIPFLIVQVEAHFKSRRAMMSDRNVALAIGELARRTGTATSALRYSQTYSGCSTRTRSHSPRSC